MIHDNADNENLGLHGFFGSICKLSAKENRRKANNEYFRNYAANCHTFSIFTPEYTIFSGENLNKVVKILFNKVLKIQDGGQSHPIISVTVLSYNISNCFQTVSTALNIPKNAVFIRL